MEEYEIERLVQAAIDNIEETIEMIEYVEEYVHG